MSLSGRHNTLIAGGIVAVLLIAFSPQVARLVDAIHRLEDQTGLLLLPAFVVLAGVAAFYVLGTRQLEEARREADARTVGELTRRAEDLDRLVALGQALGRAADFDAIRVAVAQHLPRLAGTDHVWVLVRQGLQWEALSGEAAEGDDVVQWSDIAEQMLSSLGGELSAKERTSGFPLMAGGEALGVLGVRVEGGLVTPERRAMVEAAAALLAVAIKNVKLAREVRENNVRDVLTGCFTRAHALEMADAELRRARRSQTPVSLILFDLDRFKEVNDRYGHLCGDAVLSAVGKRMREVLRGSDVKCRYGGEEFLVLLPETPLHGARRVAETLRREIAERPIPWSGDSITITASFGLAQTLPGEVNAQAIIARADQALFRAKDEGRNCVRIASDTAALATEERGR